MIYFWVEPWYAFFSAAGGFLVGAPLLVVAGLYHRWRALRSWDSITTPRAPLPSATWTVVAVVAALLAVVGLVIPVVFVPSGASMSAMFHGAGWAFGVGVGGWVGGTWGIRQAERTWRHP